VKRWTLQRARRDAVRAAWSLRYLPVPPPTGWQQRAACAGLGELFTGERSTVAAAIEVCESCPVRLHCLRAAACEERETYEPDVFGIRGGFTPAERVQLGRARAARAGAA
jgi:hypothetical protein